MREHPRPIEDILRELGACEETREYFGRFGTDYAKAWRAAKSMELSFWLAERIAGSPCGCGCGLRLASARSKTLVRGSWPKMKAALVAFGIDFVDRKGWRAHACGIGANGAAT